MTSGKMSRGNLSRGNMLGIILKSWCVSLPVFCECPWSKFTSFYENMFRSYTDQDHQRSVKYSIEHKSVKISNINSDERLLRS